MAIEHYYSMVVHPWTYQQIKWMRSLKEGGYIYAWKAMHWQTYADCQGWGINDEN